MVHVGPGRVSVSVAEEGGWGFSVGIFEGFGFDLPILLGSCSFEQDEFELLLISNLARLPNAAALVLHKEEELESAPLPNSGAGEA
jgi:hypothetical protein